MTKFGKVVWYDQRDKVGIIESNKGDQYYFDISVIKNRDDYRVKSDALVMFTQNMDIEVPKCAKNVRIL